MKKPSVSWLMTAYNCADSIGASLDSILNQTYDDFEVIIVIVGGDKSTYEVCKQYEISDRRIHTFLYMERLTIAQGLNEGIDKCSGRWIARMDSDDVCVKERLQWQVDYMLKNPKVDILAGNAYMYNIKQAKISMAYEYIFNADEIKAQLLFGNCLMHPTVLMKKEVAEKKYPQVVVEDYAFFSREISNINIEIMEEPLIQYNYKGDNNVTTKQKKRIQEECIYISRNNISRVLGINTEEYPDELFGNEHEKKSVMDRGKLLLKGYDLYKEIINKNLEKHIFLEKSLSKIIDFQWKRLIRQEECLRNLYCLSEIDVDFELIKREEIVSIFDSNKNDQ